MGKVYLAQSRGRRRVAVKVVRPEIAADPGFRERFRREMEAARAVGGFWTAPIVDADPDAATPWVASDYIAAPNLAERVNEYGPYDADELVSLAVGRARSARRVVLLVHAGRDRAVRDRHVHLRVQRLGRQLCDCAALPGPDLGRGLLGTVGPQ